eukprot:g5072.t1
MDFNRVLLLRAESSEDRALFDIPDLPPSEEGRGILGKGDGESATLGGSARRRDVAAPGNHSRSRKRANANDVLNRKIIRELRDLTSKGGYHSVITDVNAIDVLRHDSQKNDMDMEGHNVQLRHLLQYHGLPRLLLDKLEGYGRAVADAIAIPEGKEEKESVDSRVFHSHPMIRSVPLTTRAPRSTQSARRDGYRNGRVRATVLKKLVDVMRKHPLPLLKYTENLWATLIHRGWRSNSTLIPVSDSGRSSVSIRRGRDRDFYITSATDITLLGPSIDASPSSEKPAIIYFEVHVTSSSKKVRVGWRNLQKSSSPSRMQMYGSVWKAFNFSLPKKKPKLGCSPGEWAMDMHSKNLHAECEEVVCAGTSEDLVCLGCHLDLRSDENTSMCDVEVHGRGNTVGNEKGFIVGWNFDEGFGSVLHQLSAQRETLRDQSLRGHITFGLNGAWKSRHEKRRKGTTQKAWPKRHASVHGMSANAGNDEDRESRKVPSEIENDIVFEKFCDFSRSHGPIVHGAFGSGAVESAEGQESYDLPFQHAAAALLAYAEKCFIIHNEMKVAAGACPSKVGSSLSKQKLNFAVKSRMLLFSLLLSILKQCRGKGGAIVLNEQLCAAMQISCLRILLANLQMLKKEAASSGNRKQYLSFINTAGLGGRNKFSTRLRQELIHLATRNQCDDHGSKREVHSSCTVSHVASQILAEGFPIFFPSKHVRAMLLQKCILSISKMEMDRVGAKVDLTDPSLQALHESSIFEVHNIGSSWKQLAFALMDHALVDTALQNDLFPTEIAIPVWEDNHGETASAKVKTIGQKDIEETDQGPWPVDVVKRLLANLCNPEEQIEALKEADKLNFTPASVASFLRSEQSFSDHILGTAGDLEQEKQRIEALVKVAKTYVDSIDKDTAESLNNDARFSGR